MTVAAAREPQANVIAVRDERRAIGVACGVHALQDGYTDLIFVMLPIWQVAFGLTYAEVGMMRGLFSGAMAGFQVPSTFLAEKFGTAGMLAGGAAVTGCGYMLAGASGGFAMLVVSLLIGGLGASTQHPLASSLVARAFAGKRSLKALGTYNFAGDIGKMTLPAAAALMMTMMPWRPTVALLGVLGIAAAFAIVVFTPRLAETAGVEKSATVAPAIQPSRSGFPLLLSIGVIDSATRMAFLTFLPFLLTSKGADLTHIGLALSLVFAGGAAGKLVCAFIGARIGVIATVVLTEALTALVIVVLLPLTLSPAMVLLPLIGVALNGTSSVLYGSVPLLVLAEKRSRAFGFFYTGTIGAGALAPVLYGFVGDAVGIPYALIVIACVVMLTIPLAFALRPSLTRVAAA